MKASLYDEIQLLESIEADFSDRFILAGTEGTIVECYTNPIEGYAVDLAIPTETTGVYSYENVILYPHQFQVISKYISPSSVGISNFNNKEV